MKIGDMVAGLGAETSMRIARVAVVVVVSVVAAPLFLAWGVEVAAKHWYRGMRTGLGRAWRGGAE